jgi:hypothetical protein
MTEVADLSPTDASNTAITGQSLEGNVANMANMDDTLQAILGMLGRWTSSDTIASAATTDIGAQAEVYLTVSGTTTITAFGTVRTGTMRFLRFTGALTLTHNATSLILPGAANIVTAAGDTAILVSEGSGNWRCLNYLPIAPVINTLNGQYKFPAAANLSADPNTLDDFEEGTYSPNVTSSIGTITGTSGSAGVYQKVGKYVHFKSTVTITNAGTGAGFLRIGLPFTADGNFAAYGRETAATGKQLQGQIDNGTSIVSIVFYDNAWPGATGSTIVIQGFFTTAS